MWVGLGNSQGIQGDVQVPELKDGRGDLLGTFFGVCLEPFFGVCVEPLALQ